jgi:dipeptidyl aminopeptidase/acylaminoacyl peptidase
MVMMYPSLRGGNKNPGFKELCFGEVDDVLAATDYLAKQPFVDPKRIYLGGHSTGGTLVALVAERSDRYRAVFAFGPIAAVGNYGVDKLPFDYKDKRELILRSPVVWMRTTQSRLIIIEGAARSSNIDSLRKMASLPHNDKVEFHEVPDLNHFSVLAPATKMIADKLKGDVDPAGKVEFTDADFANLKGK